MREKEPPPTKNNNIFTSVNDASRHTQPQRMKTHLFILFFSPYSNWEFQTEKNKTKQDRLAIIVDQKLLAKVAMWNPAANYKGNDDRWRQLWPLSTHTDCYRRIGGLQRFRISRESRKEKKNRKEKITRRMFDQPRRVDTYKSSQANQVTRGFTRVSSDRQPRYYESSN